MDVVVVVVVLLVVASEWRSSELPLESGLESIPFVPVATASPHVFSDCFLRGHMLDCSCLCFSLNFVVSQ